MARATEAELPAIVERTSQRLSCETTPDKVGMLWTAPAVLMRLRYRRELAEQLLRRVQGMKDSVTHQAIVEEGMVRARQQDLLLIGRRRFGGSGESVELAIRTIGDGDRLTRLIDRAFDVSTWEELLAVA